jgi:lipopolysaccharide transport system permease protein
MEYNIVEMIEHTLDNSAKDEQWTEVITPTNGVFDLKLVDVWKYRDLLMLLVRRDFVSIYKQTILGPIWFFLQPLFTTLTFVIVFGQIAHISTDGMPQVLFYMTGVTLWNYFSDCLNKTSTVFRDNASIFGKVYFPRLVMPLSIVISNLIKFGIQFLLLMGFWVYYLITTDTIHPNIYMLLIPLIVLLMAAQGLGWGMIISSMTTKYRDLVFLLTFGIQLLMYATPVIYPLSSITGDYRVFIEYNPLTPLLEIFRYALLGSGAFSWTLLVYSIVSSLIVVALGAIVFTKVEKSFMDTV